MQYYAFIGEDADNVLEKRKSVRPAHLSRLQQLVDEDRLLIGGPLMQQDNGADVYGSLIIAKFDSLNEAKAWIAADPFVTERVYKNVTVKPFSEARAGACACKKPSHANHRTH